MKTTESPMERAHRLAVEATAAVAGLRRASFIASASPTELEILNARLDSLADYASAAAEYARARV